MRTKFTKDANIDWKCPHCEKYSLEILQESYKERETQKSQEYRKKYDDWDLEGIELIINGELKCKSCNEIILFIGNGNPYSYQGLDGNGEYFEESGVEFSFKYLFPTIHLFDIPKKCPEEIKEKIIDSFSLFWCDGESCVNKVRQSIEVLMNEFKINKTYLKKGKRINYPLHERIKKFPSEDVKNTLLALKWIGNSGSHHGTKLEKMDLETAYRILKYVLDKLYLDEEKEINRLSKKIIKKKGFGKKR